MPARRQLTRAPAPALLLLALLASGCDTGPLKSLSDLNALRNALRREYGHGNVNVSVHNGTTLGVQFINSKFNALDDQARRRQARRIALFARGRYPSIREIRHIWVAFQRAQSWYLVFHRNETLGAYVYDKDRVEEGDQETLLARRSNGTTASGEVIPHVTSTYSEAQGTTHVGVNHLTLYGDLDDGLILLPEFTARGRRIAAPESVDLEFVSYAPRPVFADDKRLTVTVDGRPLPTREPAQSGTGRGADGTYSEVITHKLPYKEFARLAEGREVTLRLGRREVALTAEHLRLLRDMKSCVDDSRCPE